jgi:hypothetical protein
VFRRSELTIVNSNISDNSASAGFVGGIRGFDARDLTIVNSTVSGNSVVGNDASTTCLRGATTTTPSRAGPATTACSVRMERTCSPADRAGTC